MTETTPTVENDAPMSDAERIERLGRMCDRLAAKAADQAEVIARVNAKVDDWLERGKTSATQDGRAFANAYALEMIHDGLRDARVIPPAVDPS